VLVATVFLLMLLVLLGRRRWWCLLEGSYVAEGGAVAVAVQGPADAALIGGRWRAAGPYRVYGCAAWL
jgi:hypothetical protein